MTICLLCYPNVLKYIDCIPVQLPTETKYRRVLRSQTLVHTTVSTPSGPECASPSQQNVFVENILPLAMRNGGQGIELGLHLCSSNYARMWLRLHDCLLLLLVPMFWSSVVRRFGFEPVHQRQEGNSPNGSNWCGTEQELLYVSHNILF